LDMADPFQGYQNGQQAHQVPIMRWPLSIYLANSTTGDSSLQAL
jgi:hypothetical protein